MYFCWAMKKIFFVLFFSLNAIFLLAQSVSDCAGALDINDTLFIQNNVFKDYGKVLEIKGSGSKDSCFFEREHYSAWYRFSTKLSTILSFEIIPMEVRDDFDFLLFKDETKGTFCNENKNPNGILPIRSNISRNDLGLQSKTGLTKDAVNNYVPEGIGNVYSKSIKVNKGEIYYLVIDSPRPTKGGYSIVLHYDRYLDWYTDYKREMEASLRKEVETVLVPNPVLHILVCDKVTQLPIKAKLEITGIKPNETVVADTSHFSFETGNLMTYKINCNAEGYMYNASSFTYKDKEKDTLFLQLAKIKVGEKITLNDIYFEGDDVAFLPKSKPSLQNLLAFMRQNPSTKIEIMGHVNGPDSKNKTRYKRLSQNRAKAVQEYLTINKVSKGRVKAKGYGNSQMIYFHPENGRQSEANRRVEIKIISQ